MILLVDKREAVGINLRNPYLFATPSACSVSHLRPNGTAYMEWLMYKAVILKILRPSQALPWENIVLQFLKCWTLKINN